MWNACVSLKMSSSKQIVFLNKVNFSYATWGLGVILSHNNEWAKFTDC